MNIMQHEYHDLQYIVCLKKKEEIKEGRRKTDKKFIFKNAIVLYASNTFCHFLDLLDIYI